MAEQAGRLAYAHGSAFTTEPLEAYAAEVGPLLPVDDPAIYPVSGGSEAIETALKLARAYHLARGESDRWTVFARWGSYHGNTLGALDLSGRRPLRRPYEGWLGPLPPPLGGLPVSGGRSGCERPRRPGRTGARARPRDRSRRSRDGGRVRRRADRRGDAGRGRPARRLLAGDRRGLSPARCPADRRRGDDRVRADRSLVRAGSLGHSRRTSSLRPRGPRPGTGRSGSSPSSGRVHDAVTAPGCGLRPRLHLFARARWRGGRARGPADPARGIAGRGERRQGRAACRSLLRDWLGEHPAVGDIRGAGLLVGARARGGPRDAAAISRAPRESPRPSSGKPASGACCSTRAPATPTARTAT